MRDRAPVLRCVDRVGGNVVDAEARLPLGVSEVVWGVTTLANGTAFTLDYRRRLSRRGRGRSRSIVHRVQPHATRPGNYTVTLTVGAEIATVDVSVFNGGDAVGISTSAA